MRDAHSTQFEELKKNRTFTSEHNRDYEISNFNYSPMMISPNEKN